MPMLRKLYGWLIGHFLSIRWNASYKRISRISKTTINNNKALFNNSIIIAPHADDELIGCFSVLKRNHPFVFLCSLTGSNRTEDNKKRRENEFCNCMKLLDCQYAISDGKLESELLDIFRKNNPSYVFIPTYVDWHDEHRLISEIMYKLISKQPQLKFKIVFYPVSVPIAQNTVNLCNQLSRKEFKEKFATFKSVYISQQSINIKRFKFYQTHYVKNGIVEPFSVFEIGAWKKTYLNMQKELENKDLLSLKEHLNDLVFVNDFVNSL